VVEITVAIGEEFEVALPDDIGDKFVTVEDVVGYFQNVGDGANDHSLLERRLFP
jgi:acyl carrier protein